MSAMTRIPLREIIEDFANEIREKRLKTAKPAKDVINFRTDIRDQLERTIWRVPLAILRFRKDNGRIASDVMNYENNIGPLHETDDGSQQVIRKFLADKDPEKRGILRKSILHDGQREPAIITCDGFLINGNRRKMVMEELHRENPSSDSFSYMKCVILPGKDDEGGPPTLLEIEKLENKYQLQTDPPGTSNVSCSCRGDNPSGRPGATAVPSQCPMKGCGAAANRPAILSALGFIQVTQGWQRVDANPKPPRFSCNLHTLFILHQTPNV